MRELHDEPIVVVDQRWIARLTDEELDEIYREQMERRSRPIPIEWPEGERHEGTE